MIMQNDVIKFPLVKPLLHSNFDSDALKVYKRLHENRYKTYFVGGCIRDLLLGKIPKDFDIATAARPNQIHKLFWNSRIIGRRFMIVSVIFGMKVVEVTTFRRSPWKGSLPENGDLLLNSDNVFGTDEEDALRRDFTINALFYDITERTVIDYVNGLYDLQHGLIRCIGDPEVRFSEDPVRIIRALKMQAILGFEIEPVTNHAISKCVGNVRHTAPARLLLELQKMLKSGSSYDCFDQLADSSIFSIVAPDIHRLWCQSKQFSGHLMRKMLHTLDSLESKKRNHLHDVVLLSPIYFPILLRDIHKVKSLEDFCKQKLMRLINNISISKKNLERITEIIYIQNQLENSNLLLSKNKKILKHPAFIDALEVFYLINQDEPKKIEAYNLWKSFYSKEQNVKKKTK